MLCADIVELALALMPMFEKSCPERFLACRVDCHARAVGGALLIVAPEFNLFFIEYVCP